ncbi:MAG: DUF4340 domain-containing protein [Pseudomonadota bacterium]
MGAIMVYLFEVGAVFPAEKIMSRPIFHFVLLSLVIPFAAPGCTDKAKSDFDRCEQLEQTRKFDEARKACELAHSKAPDSEAGKLAAAKLPVLATEQKEYDRAEGSAYKSPTQQPLPALHVETSKIDHIEITPPGQPRVVLERKDGAWRLTAPQDALANDKSVASLVENLGQLQVTEILDSTPRAPSIEKFKTADATATHVLVKSGSASLFEGWFGDGGSRGQAMRLAGDDRILAVKGYHSYLYNRQPSAWASRSPVGG